MTRTLRRFAAVVALVGLASAQAALAAYICPVDAGRAPTAAIEHAQCGTQADPALAGALCELHCQVTASVPSAPAADAAVPAVVPLVVAGACGHALPRDASVTPVPPAALATAPPVAIRYCRLLI